MSAGNVIRDVAIAVFSGGAAGWVSSVYAAGPVARRQHAEKRRREACDRIDAELDGYVGRLRVIQESTRSTIPANWNDLASREALAVGILADLPRLPRHDRVRIRRKLPDLVGRETLQVAERLVGIPDDAQPLPADENSRREQVERHMRMDYHEGVGCEQKNRHLCERDHLPLVREEYGALGALWFTGGYGHFHPLRSGMFSSAYAALNAVKSTRRLRDWLRR